MFKGNRKYYFFIGLAFLLAVLIQYLEPKEISWKKSYMKEDRIPFGSYALYEVVSPGLFDKKETNRIPLYNLHNSTNGDGHSLLIFNTSFSPKRLDLAALFDFVAEGNTVLISANQFGGKFSDTLKLETQTNWLKPNVSLDSMLRSKTFSLRFQHPGLDTTQRYFYSEAASASYFSKYDSTRFRVLSVDQEEHPVLLQTNIGKGRLYLGSVPDVFANLYVVNHPNRKYAYGVLSLLDQKELLWDEYYKDANQSSESAFGFIFANDSLYSGYVLLMLSLVLFMIFGLKRRQRAIPVIAPLENTTLQFVEVISHVYFKSANHQHIAHEKIKYYYASIRKKFNLSTEHIDGEFLDRLSQLSGVPEIDLRRIFTCCEQLRKAGSATEGDLLELSKWINYFNTKSIR